MKYTVKTTKNFESDVKRCKKRGYDMKALEAVIRLLAADVCLPKKYSPHKLTGDYKDYWECHIKPDWLLIWLQNDKELILLFTNTGTHSDLF